MTTPSHVMNLNSEPERTQDHDGRRQIAREQYRHRSYEALLSHDVANTQHLWDDLPVPSVTDTTEQQLMKPKTLWDCCQCARSFNEEYELPTGKGAIGVDLKRVKEYKAMIDSELKGGVRGC